MFCSLFLSYGDFAAINDGETVHLEEVMEVMTKEERELV
jgi:hypothetical protein